MRVGSLFTGIGGLDLGLQRAGFEIKWQVEVDDFCTRVLEKHWPNVKRYGDIRTLRGDELEPVDLICGGFPCQPFSLAGRRRGTADDRYLWPEMFRIIKALRPRWVLGENVVGIVNMALDTMLSDLESSGYKTATFIIPACAVGAPHRRDRVWIVAYSSRNVLHGTGARGPEWRAESSNGGTHVANSDGQAGGISWSTGEALLRPAPFQRHGRCGCCDGTKHEASEPLLGGVLDGSADWLDGHRWPAPFGCEQYEWEPPRTVAIRIPDRGKRLEALGNAVVPQVAEVIGRAIIRAERRREHGVDH